MRPTRIFVWISIFLALIFLQSAVAEAKPLAYGRLVQVMGCLSQKNAPIHLDSDYSDAKSFRVRYVYGVRDTVDEKESDLLLIVYGKDDEHAMLLLLAIDKPDLAGMILFRDAAPVEYIRNHWEIGELYNGGVGTYRWLRRLVARASATPLRAIPRSDVTVPAAACWWKPAPIQR